MSEQTKDETKSGNITATPAQSEVVEKTEKDASHLTEDELTKISGGLSKPPYNDQY